MSKRSREPIPLKDITHITGWTNAGDLNPAEQAAIKSNRARGVTRRHPRLKDSSDNFTNGRPVFIYPYNLPVGNPDSTPEYESLMDSLRDPVVKGLMRRYWKAPDSIMAYVHSHVLDSAIDGTDEKIGFKSTVVVDHDPEANRVLEAIVEMRGIVLKDLIPVPDRRSFFERLLGIPAPEPKVKFRYEVVNNARVPVISSPLEHYQEREITKDKAVFYNAVAERHPDFKFGIHALHFGTEGF